MGWRASRDSNPDLRFWRPPSCRWTTDPQGVLARRHGFEPRSRESESRVLPIERAPHRWLGALDSNQVLKVQSLVSCRLDERRMGGTAGAIRTPVLDRRRVAPCSSELQPYWRYAENGFKPPASAFAWLPETVSNRRHSLCKSGALPAELPGSGRGGRNRTDNGGVMSPARGHLPLINVVRAAVIETAASTMATSRSAD